MTQAQIQHLFQQRYNQNNWKQFLGETFVNAQLLTKPEVISDINTHAASTAFKLGYIILNENGIERNIAVYEVILEKGIVLERNRVGLRNLLRKYWKEIDAAFIVYHNPENSSWRFTYVSELTGFNTEGERITVKTEPKRYTYILGEGESCRTASERFVKIANKGKNTTLDDVKDAFSVEKLSKAFFDEYKKHYNIFCDFMVSKPNIRQTIFNGDEKGIRDFNKKLLGRIVFLYFIQKKGWLGVPVKSEWGKGDFNFLANLFKNNKYPDLFYSELLSKLFFDTLNTKRKDDLIEFEKDKPCRVPFLNGGLFEEDDKKQRNIIFPALLFENLFGFFNQYNFTIYEDDPNDHTVAVDPEMLGHIFENLLEDNKDKGAYYTPKEIVHYMCHESLIEYLATHLEIRNKESKIERTALEKFIKHTEVTKEIIPHFNDIDQLLDSVKICDPAIGSGAFPMGLLHEIFTAKQTIYIFEHGNATNFDASKVKLSIIQNSIYGVDIEKGAVDIARLRVWLSLIVDEPEPKTLPNLDYKIVVGNSLFSELGDDIINIDWNLKETAHGLFGDELAKQKGELLKKISQEQKDFFNPASDKKKLAVDIRNLKIDLLINQLELMVKTQGIENKPSGTSKSLGKQTGIYFQTLRWKNNIVQLKKLKTESELVLNFFDWKLDFPEVMNEQVAIKTGFDIVIANPPYIGQKGNKTLFEPLCEDSNFETKMDYWYFFLHKSYTLSKDSGVNTFITPNYWITAQGGKKIRKRIVENYAIVEYINFNDNAIFAAGVHTNIFVLKKNELPNTNIKCTIYQNKYSENIFNYKNLELNFNTNQNKIFSPWTGFVHFLPDCIYEIIQKLIKDCEKLSDDESSGESIKGTIPGKKVTNGICNISPGIESGKDKGIYVLAKDEINNLNLDKNEIKLVRRFYKNSDINKYFILDNSDKYFLYVNSIELEEEFLKYKNLYIHFLKHKEALAGRAKNGVLESAYKKGKWWALKTDRPNINWASNKIVCPQRSKKNTFALASESFLSSVDVYYISKNSDDYDLKYILPILNSRVIYFWLYWMGKRKGEMLELYFEPLQFIPIKKCNYPTQQIFIEKANKIISLKSESKETSAIEQQIDNLVYKLYELTYDEVKIIDPDFGLTEQEYDAINI